MSSNQENSRQPALPFIFSRADLISTRTGVPNQFVSHDIRDAIVDVIIYEQLDKPYTTCAITYVDNADTLSSLDIQGGEIFHLEIKPSVDPQAPGIKKDYYVMSISNSVRTSDLMETQTIHCVDKNYFESIRKNCNDPLVGTPLSMILEVANNYFNELNIIHNKNDYKESHRVIVPNKPPLKAMSWLNAMNMTSIGLPYFLYATMGDDTLRYFSLEDLITQETFNADKPLTYGFHTTMETVQTNDVIQNSFSIQHYHYKNTHRLHDLIDRGFTSAIHKYYDTTVNRQFVVDFSAVNAMKELHANDIYSQNQTRYNIPAGQTFENEEFFEKVHRVYQHVSSSRPYTGHLSYHQKSDDATYLNETNREAYRNYLVKEPITVQFDGKYLGVLHGVLRKEFPSAPHLIGQKVRILFKRTTENPTKDNAALDIKKSGDYIVHAVKHVLQRERYDIQMTGVKIQSYDDGKVVAK